MNCTPRECVCPKHKIHPYRKLTFTLLDCWQRRNDVRPYNSLMISGKEFEKVFHRRPDHSDIKLISTFIDCRRNVTAVELIYMDIPPALCASLVRYCARKKVVCFSNTDMSARGLESLAVNVESSKIEVLRLNGVFLTRDDVEFLHSFVSKSKHLKYLDVGNCGLDQATFSMIADAVWKSKPIRIVNMSRVMPLSDKNVLDGAQIVPFIAILIKQTFLTEVHFQKCSLNCDDMIPIAEYLCEKKPIPLTYIDLASNNIGPKGVGILFQALKKARYNSNLIGVNLSNNILGKHGGELISRLLPFTKIRYLDISFNAIPASAIELILYTIKKPCAISILNVAGNSYNCEVGKILLRQIHAEVLIANSIDLFVVYCEQCDCYCVSSRKNIKTNINQRYYRVTPYYRKYDIILHKPFLANAVAADKLRFRGMFIDPIVADCCDKIFNFGESDETTAQDVQEIMSCE